MGFQAVQAFNVTSNSEDNIHQLFGSCPLSHGYSFINLWRWHSNQSSCHHQIENVNKLGWLQAYANTKGVRIMGDMPIYVGGQSADVWANQELFELGKDGAPLNVSGVPPDAFSETGQLWGSPLYDWKVQSPLIAAAD